MITFHNHKARVAWGFAAVSLALVAAMTYVFWRDGPPPGYSQPFIAIVLALFWLFGLAGASFAASHACLTVTVRPDGGIHILRRLPFRREERIVADSDVAGACVVESRDDEGDPYFHARLNLRDGSRVDLVEGHDRERCESACERFNAALRRDSAGQVPCHHG